VTADRPADPEEPAGAADLVPPAGTVDLVEVAVPIPLPPLTYQVPPAFRHLAVPGARARVRVGPRRLTGVIVGRPEEPPEGVKLRPLEEVLDREPAFPADLLDLARFTADYYRAPLGEVLRGMLPGDLPPWGHQKVRLTSGGAIAPPSDELEAEVVRVLMEGGRLSASEVQARVGRPGVAEAIDRLAERGRVLLEGRERRGARYLSGVELAPGDLESHLEVAGRSAPGRAVIELLAALGRPATVEELTHEIGCTPAVVRRLVKLGALRRFTQIERLSLDHQGLQRSGKEKVPIVLRPDQEAAFRSLADGVTRGGYHAYLIQGMTASGKTEVYLRAVEHALSEGRSSILMVPEIALVPALVREVVARFGRRGAILHSALGSSERHQEWERIRRGEARVVVGPRSALFAPVADLGLIVVDEEQDEAYKQDQVPRYHGRDLALVRATQAREGKGATAALVSATPSLESRLNAERGKLSALSLTVRAGQGSLPEGILVDLREEPASPRKPGEVTFSERLKQEIRATHDAGDQIILLRNRRGYAPVLLCRACGEKQECEACGIPRTFHRGRGLLLCHYCGSADPAPTACPACGEEALEPIGAGTERVEERFRDLFPDIPVDVLDRDVVRRKGGVAAVLARFGRGETRALIGTQMVSKGHHFPDVALTAVLSADTYLGFADFRAVERTYTLLTQLAGRAGRGERPGRVVVQTYFPDHYAIRAALDHDDELFAREEMRFRRAFHYPPYTRMVQLLVRDGDRGKAEAAARKIARAIAADPASREVRTAGPAPAPFERLRNQWRYQMLLRHPSTKLLHGLLDRALPEKLDVDLVVDVDPYDLL
jgi:primosomal protein N' (replication factor Y) (superfamily II helicase)